MPILLDLREDFDRLYSYVAERVRSFNPATNAGPGDPGPVTHIEFGYDFEHKGWVALVFDTRPDAVPDGHWNFYIEETKLVRPLWHYAFEVANEQSATLILLDGTERALPFETRREYASVFGDLLKKVLIKARADGVFAALPRASRCALGVEEYEGGYGWPVWDDQGKENLI